MSFVAIASPAPEVIYCLDDTGEVWCGALSPGGAWIWKSIEIPVEIRERKRKPKQRKRMGPGEHDGEEDDDAEEEHKPTAAMLKLIEEYDEEFGEKTYDPKSPAHVEQLERWLTARGIGNAKALRADKKRGSGGGVA